MSQDRGLKNLKVVLALFFVSYLFYGFSFLFLPGLLSEISGDPVHLGWIRWSGAPLIALGLGAIQTYRNPAKNRSFVTVAIVSSVLIGSALLYSKLFEPTPKHAWFTLTPCFINLGLFALLLWARKGAREILE